MRKMLLQVSSAVMVMALVSGCSWFRKKGSTDASGVNVESTANGGSEKLDSSPMNMGATGSDSESIQGLRTVFFDYDKAVLSSSEQEKLMANVEWMKKNAGAKLTVEGHCDQRGSAEYNLALGERRANAVRQMLISNGISGSRITTVSFGKEKPLAQGDSEEAMAKNRRANFVPVQ